MPETLDQALTDGLIEMLVEAEMHAWKNYYPYCCAVVGCWCGSNPNGRK